MRPRYVNVSAYAMLQEFIIKGENIIGAAIIKEETLIAKEAPTALRGNKEHGDKEYELGKLASINTSTAGDKTISNTEFFADTVSYQSLDNDLY